MAGASHSMPTMAEAIPRSWVFTAVSRHRLFDRRLQPEQALRRAIMRSTRERPRIPKPGITKAAADGRAAERALRARRLCVKLREFQ